MPGGEKDDGKILHLESADATITTATISIKALQIGKKQMTQSVFKQLPVAPLIDEEAATLQGTVWGHVNYGVAPSYRHFVYQKGTRLYRDTVRLWRCSEFVLKEHQRYPMPPAAHKALVETKERMKRHVVSVNLLAGWTPEKTDFGRHYRIDFTIPGQEHITLQVSLGQNAIKLIGMASSEGTKIDRDQSDHGREKEYRAELQKEIIEFFGNMPTAEEANQLLATACLRLDDYCHRWDAMMDSLEAAEQLFIAV
jgi:hypothetical protein